MNRIEMSGPKRHPPHWGWETCCFPPFANDYHLLCANGSIFNGLQHCEHGHFTFSSLLTNTVSPWVSPWHVWSNGCAATTLLPTAFVELRHPCSTDIGAFAASTVYGRSVPGWYLTYLSQICCGGQADELFSVYWGGCYVLRLDDPKMMVAAVTWLWRLP